MYISTTNSSRYFFYKLCVTITLFEIENDLLQNKHTDIKLFLYEFLKYKGGILWHHCIHIKPKDDTLLTRNFFVRRTRLHKEVTSLGFRQWYSYLVFHPSCLIQAIFQLFFIRSRLPRLHPGADLIGYALSRPLVLY